jgi:hypothetical protein
MRIPDNIETITRLLRNLDTVSLRQLLLLLLVLLLLLKLLLLLLLSLLDESWKNIATALCIKTQLY